jgi:hypothetical protein
MISAEYLSLQLQSKKFPTIRLNADPVRSVDDTVFEEEVIRTRLTRRKYLKNLQDRSSIAFCNGPKQ